MYLRRLLKVNGGENAGLPVASGFASDLYEGRDSRATVKSSHHAVLSLVVSLAVVGVLRPSAPMALVAAGTVVGVAIDVDHFPIARARMGDWQAARRVLRNPLLVVTAPERIFPTGEIHPLERLLSHVVLAGPLLAVAWLAWPALGVVLGVSLYVHLVSDIAWDVWRLHRTDGGPSF